MAAGSFSQEPEAVKLLARTHHITLLNSTRGQALLRAWVSREEKEEAEAGVDSEGHFCHVILRVTSAALVVNPWQCLLHQPYC